MSHANQSIGWSDQSPNDPEVIKLRDHLETKNGSKGLSILEHDDIVQAVRVFQRGSFVVIGGILDTEQIDFLAKDCDEDIREVGPGSVELLTSILYVPEITLSTQTLAQLDEIFPPFGERQKLTPGNYCPSKKPFTATR